MILFFFSPSFISISFQSSREALITRLSFMCIDVLSGSVLTDAVPKGKIYEIAMPVTSITAGLFCLSLFLISIAYFLHCQCTIWKRVFSFFYRRSIRLYFNRRCSIKTYIKNHGTSCSSFNCSLYFRLLYSKNFQILLVW